MRVKRGCGAGGLVLPTERSPLEAGLAPLVKTDGRDFIGREALLARADDGAGSWRVDPPAPAAKADRAPFYPPAVNQAGGAGGIVTSGAFGHRVKKPLALAYLRPG